MVDCKNTDMVILQGPENLHQWVWNSQIQCLKLGLETYLYDAHLQFRRRPQIEDVFPEMRSSQSSSSSTTQTSLLYDTNSLKECVDNAWYLKQGGMLLKLDDDASKYKELPTSPYRNEKMLESAGKFSSGFRLSHVVFEEQVEHYKNSMKVMSILATSICDDLLHHLSGESSPLIVIHKMLTLCGDNSRIQQDLQDYKSALSKLKNGTTDIYVSQHLRKALLLAKKIQGLETHSRQGFFQMICDSFPTTKWKQITKNPSIMQALVEQPSLYEFERLLLEYGRACDNLRAPVLYPSPPQFHEGSAQNHLADSMEMD